MNAYKTIGPAFSRRLRETPDNPDLAYQKALGDTVLSAGGTAVSWGAYPLKFFEGPVYNFVMQAFGIQPGIGATQKAVSNLREGKPILEGQSETYLESAAGTAVPAIGHAGINIASGKPMFGGWEGRPLETAPPVPRPPQPPVGPTDAGLLRARRFQEPFGTADLQRFLQQENLNAPRSTPSSPISGQLYSSGLNDRGYIPERPTGPISPRFRPEPTSVRQRLREFEGGPVEAGPPIAAPEGQPGPRPEAEGAMAPPDQGRPAYMATREELARQSFTPEEVQALREEGLSPEQARVSGREPQSRRNVNQEQPTSLEEEREVIGKAFDINQPVWQKRILELMRQGYKGKELSDALRERYGADTAGMGVLPGQRAGLPGSHQFGHHRTFPPAPGLPSPASGMLRTGQRTSRQRGDRGYVAPRGQDTALSQAGEQQARTLYERRVAEIEASELPAQDRKEALRVAAREYQNRIEERVQERRGFEAGRPKKYNWESIAENWAGKEWGALSKKEQEALKNAYRYYERSSGKLHRVQEEAARQEGEQPPKYTPTKRSEAFSPKPKEDIPGYKKPAVERNADPDKQRELYYRVLRKPAELTTLREVYSRLRKHKSLTQDERNYYGVMYDYLRNNDGGYRNSIVEAYNRLSGGQARKPVKFEDAFWEYQRIVKDIPKEEQTRGEGTRGRKAFVPKDFRSFKRHFYTFGRELGEHYPGTPRMPAPWVIDERNGTVFFDPYRPDAVNRVRFANELPLEPGLREIENVPNEPLVPEVPKGRIPGGAQHHRTFTPAPGLPSPASGMLRTGGRTSAMAKGSKWGGVKGREWLDEYFTHEEPPKDTSSDMRVYRKWLEDAYDMAGIPKGESRPEIDKIVREELTKRAARTGRKSRQRAGDGGWSRAQQEWMAFQYQRYRAEQRTNPNTPSFEDWLKAQPKEKLRETWGGKSAPPGSGGGGGPSGPPRPPVGRVGAGAGDIKPPKPPKTTPMGRRVEGEKAMRPEDYGSPYRAGSSGLPLGGPKPNQRRQFVNPEPRTGMWAQVLKIVSPTGMSYKSARGKPLEPSRAAEQIIRAIEGQGRRQTARGSADMEPFVKAVYDLPRDAQLDLVHYIQTGGTEGALASLKKTHPKAVRQFERFTKMLANLYKSYEVEISTLDRGERQNFIKNYLPQLWREKDAWPSRSATFLKERKMPTYKDAMALKDKDGKPLFTPVTENPIEMTMMYMAAMRKFLDIRHSVQEARLAGYVRDLPYKHSPPPNTRLLNFTGRGGKRYYANEDFARVFNNYVSRGLHNSPELGSLHNAMLRLTNASTSLQLGLSAFHLSTMAKEGFLANLSDGIKALSQGKPVRGLRKIASSVVPGSYYRKGDQLLRAYLGQDFVSPEMEHMAQLAAKANMRLGELDEVYRATAMGSYAKNIVRGLQAGEGVRAGLKWAAKTEGKQFLKDVQAKPITSSLQLGGKLIETVAHPLFYHYIPRLKAGVFMERMSDFLRDNPEADMATQVREAQRFADVIDDQFGELVQNNLFWDATLKQTANLLLTSTGWTLGTLRLFGQGTADVLRGIGKTVTTGRAQPLTDRSAYLIATVIGVATLNALYQGIKAGQQPESIQDLATPRTGGETYQGDPERALIPGYEKDIMGWWHDPQGELYNKLGPLPKTVTEMYLNKDWRGDPIRDRMADPLTQALQTAGHSLWNFSISNPQGMMFPITLKSAFAPTSPETNLSVPERLMGVRAAGGWITNPERTEALENRASSRAWKRKLKHEERDKARRGFSYDDLVVPEPAPKPRRGFSYEDLQ